MRVTALAMKTPTVSAATASQPTRAAQSQRPRKRVEMCSAGSAGAESAAFDALVSGLVIASLVQIPIYPLASFYAIQECSDRGTLLRPCQ